MQLASENSPRRWANWLDKTERPPQRVGCKPGPLLRCGRRTGRSHPRTAGNVKRLRPSMSTFVAMRPETRSYYADLVHEAIEFIAHHLDVALDLPTLAAGSGLSPFHFHRVFHGMVGETPLELVRRLRMERAASRLATTDIGVTQIAFEAGYETHEAFSRAFKSFYGASPSEHRRHRARAQIAATSGIHYSADKGVPIPRFTTMDTGGKHMQVDIRDLPERRLATVRHLGAYNQIYTAFGRLGAVAGPAGLFREPGAAMVALYHDDPETTPPDQLRSDAGLVVGHTAAIPTGLVEQRLPAGRYACTVHVGPYERLGDVWLRFLGEWLPASGHRLGSGPSFELYLNDPTTTPKSELRTELCAPLE